MIGQYPMFKISKPFQFDFKRGVLLNERITEDDIWTLAIDGFSLYSGCLYSLRGENMSGKTTLIRILSGNINHGDPLEVSFKNRIFSLARDRYKIARHGLAVSHQNDSMFPDLSIWENIQLGCRGIRASAREIQKKSIEYMKSFSTSLTVGDNPLSTVSGGAKAIIHLLRTTLWGFDLLLLDEPTTNLSAGNKDKYFCILEKLIDAQRCVLLVSHDDQDHAQLRSIADNKHMTYHEIALKLDGNSSCLVREA